MLPTQYSQLLVNSLHQPHRLIRSAGGTCDAIGGAASEPLIGCVSDAEPGGAVGDDEPAGHAGAAADPAGPADATD